MGLSPLCGPEMFEGAVREASEGVLVDVHVRPHAPETRIAGYHEGRRAIRVDVAANPEGGEANRALARFVAGLVGGTVSVVRGGSSRHKTLLVHGVRRDAILAAFARGAR